MEDERGPAAARVFRRRPCSAKWVTKKRVLGIFCVAVCVCGFLCHPLTCQSSSRFGLTKSIRVRGFQKGKELGSEPLQKSHNNPSQYLVNASWHR